MLCSSGGTFDRIKDGRKLVVPITHLALRQLPKERIQFVFDYTAGQTMVTDVTDALGPRLESEFIKRGVRPDQLDPYVGSATQHGSDLVRKMSMYVLIKITWASGIFRIGTIFYTLSSSSKNLPIPRSLASRTRFASGDSAGGGCGTITPRLPDGAEKGPEASVTLCVCFRKLNHCEHLPAP